MSVFVGSSVNCFGSVIVTINHNYILSFFLFSFMFFKFGCYIQSILSFSKMNETQLKHKPADQTKLRTKFIISQCSVQQSFKEPIRPISSILTLFVYIQCLKYSIDFYSNQWFNSTIFIFSNLDPSYYSRTIPSFVTSTIGIFYVIFSFCVGIGWLQGKNVFKVAKISQMLFGSIFFMWVISDNCNSIYKYFKTTQQSLAAVIFSFLSLIIFSFFISLQTFTRFDFTTGKSMNGAIRESTWSVVTLLLYIIVNEISWRFSEPGNLIHQITRDIFFGLHVFVFFFKWQIQHQPLLKLQLCGILVNFIAIVIQSSNGIFQIHFGIGLLLIISIIIITSMYNVQFFNIAFELQNVNKWTNSQIIISYTSKLRKILRNYQNYYFNTLFLGYVEIHQQKCDNASCPLHNLNMIADEKIKKSKFQDIINKIYNDGYKISSINPQLQLEYSIFLYEIGSKQKSLKTLLDIKEDLLPLDKYYKFIRIKKLIHKQTCEVPEQQFLDFISEIKIKDLEERIIKKFDESALTSLQFWSILNEDHPDFTKLYEIGKLKVVINEQVESLYKKINEIANSERITGLYIHYLNQIENQQKMFSEVEQEMHKEEGYDEKIIIQDWVNNPSPIMIVSLEQENLGVILDLNTTCATFLGQQKFDLIGKEIKTLFPGELMNQLEYFMDIKKGKTDQFFYIKYNNSFVIKIFRKIQPFNSIVTGFSLIITFQNKFYPNTGFLIFNSQSKLISMSSSCIKLLDFEQNLLETQTHYNDLFDVAARDINEEKTILILEYFLKEARVSMYQERLNFDSRVLERTFNVTKREANQFLVLNFQLLRSSKKIDNSASRAENMSKLQLSAKNEENMLQDQLYETECSNKFMFSLAWDQDQNQDQFAFIGSYQPPPTQTLSLKPPKSPTLKQPTSQRPQKYEQNIKTLRLYENYIKVIEQSQQQQQQQNNGEYKQYRQQQRQQLESQTSTNNQLAQKYTISKVDTQTIFENKKKYHQFVDRSQNKVCIRVVLVMAVLGCLAVYTGILLTATNNYNVIEQSCYRYSFGNRILGLIAQTNRIIIQSKYQSLIHNPTSDLLLLQNYNQTLIIFQQMMKSYTQPYQIQIYINKQTRNKIKSDEFLLSMISQFSKIQNKVTNNEGFMNFDKQDSSSMYVEINGKVTKEKMYAHVGNFKNNAKIRSANLLNVVIILNAFGIVFTILLTLCITFTLKKINEYKLQILSVFLQTKDKDIQNYTQKAQNFLITLRADQQNDNNEGVDELFDDKKNTSAMFTKKKRFKQTNFQKIPYVILSLFFFFASGFYIHLLSFSIQKNIFIQDAIEYFGIISGYGDVFGSNQAKIYQRLIDNVGTNQTSYDSKLAAQINAQIISYQRQLFTWHYHTYGSIDKYHQNFATVFMRDICNGRIKIKHACDSGIMAENGALLLITDISMQIGNIDYSKPFNHQLFLQFESIKHAHKFLVDNVFQTSKEFFMDMQNSILKIFFIWMSVMLAVGSILYIYVQKCILQDLRLVKCMLKFLPISFAKNSEGVKKFIGSIIDQK